MPKYLVEWSRGLKQLFQSVFPIKPIIWHWLIIGDILIPEIMGEVHFTSDENNYAEWSGKFNHLPLVTKIIGVLIKYIWMQVKLA